MMKKILNFIIPFRWIGLVITLSLAILSIRNRNTELLGISLAVLFPLFVFVALSNYPKLSMSLRTLIAALFSAIGGTAFFAINDRSSLIAGLIIGWWVIVLLTLAGLAILLVFGSLALALEKNKKQSGMFLLAFFLIAISIRTCIALPTETMYFYWKLPAFETSIESVRNGTLIPDSYGRVDTPPEYGFIMLHVRNDNGNLSFFFHSTVLVSGYLYTENGIPARYTDCKKIEGQESWFFCTD